MFAWSAVAFVLVVVLLLVLVSQGVGRRTTVDISYTPEPVPATILHEITHVPASSYNAVGVTEALARPSVPSGRRALTFTGKPGVFGLFGEFCPFCAAERWSIITALARFGTFSGLRTMQSSPNDADPKTQTFEFATTTYSSLYISAKLLEMFGQETAAGKRPRIGTPTMGEERIIKTYDPTGTIPFFDVGNAVVSSGASFTPGVLKGLSRTTIAAGLSQPSDPVARLILGDANFLSAGVCSIDGGKPVAVCSSHGVRAAASALGLNP